MNLHSGISQSPRVWPRMRLSELAEHRLGKMLDKAKNTGVPRPYLRNPNIRWFDVDLSDLQEILVEEKDVDKYELRVGDVLICEGGEAGRAAIWKGEAQNVIFQKACHRVRPGARLDARFLVHRLMYDYFTGGLNDYYTGTTIKHFTGQDLARYEIPLPQLNEQRRIAAILDKADALRRKRRRAIQLLDDLILSIFLEIFGEPDSDHFPKSTLDQIALKITDGEHQNPKFTTSGMPMIMASQVRDDGVLIKGAKFVSVEDGDRFRRKCSPEKGDLLIVGRGATIGRTTIVDTVDPFCLMGSVILVKPNFSVVESAYLVAFFKHPKIRTALYGTSGSSAQQAIYISHLKKMEVPLPSLQKQREFASKTASVTKRIRECLYQVELMNDLFSSLQHRAFSGRL